MYVSSETENETVTKKKLCKKRVASGEKTK